VIDNVLLLFQAPVIGVDLIINGLLVGAIFALAAYGLALVWGVMNILNIAQGEFVMLGGYVAMVLYWNGIHPLFAVPLAPIILYGIGWALYRLVVFRVVDRDLFVSLLATFGLSILLQQLMNTVFTGNIQTARSDLGSTQLFGGSVAIANIKVLALSWPSCWAAFWWPLCASRVLGRRSAPRRRMRAPPACSASIPTGCMRSPSGLTPRSAAPAGR
jgi:branched-chain amino acid transport system permease protein